MTVLLSTLLTLLLIIITTINTIINALPALQIRKVSFRDRAYEIMTSNAMGARPEYAFQELHLDNGQAGRPPCAPKSCRIELGLIRLGLD